MGYLSITGGQKLQGEINISGSKNSVLPILAASLLTEEILYIDNIPHLDDVTNMMALLSHLGVKITIQDDLIISIESKALHTFHVNSELARAMRASILVLGPLLSKHQEARVALPGGCAIGNRPIDWHIAGLEKLGASIAINDKDNSIIAKSNGRLVGAEINFPRQTVTGTENLIMAASLAAGQTILNNAAREPEVTDLANFINYMGGDVRGAGTSKIVINGVKKLSPPKNTHYRVIPDRIETGTFLVAAVATGGKIKLNNTNPDLLPVVLDKLLETGAEIECADNSICINMLNQRPKSVDISTGPFPEFPTDLQAQFVVLNSIAHDVALVTENIWENRFKHIYELHKMGAKILVKDHQAQIFGQDKLTGSIVQATDLRASASLVIAGLVAEGITKVANIHHIDRGYECIEEKLMQLGAIIERHH